MIWEDIVFHIFVAKKCYKLNNCWKKLTKIIESKRTKKKKHLKIRLLVCEFIEMNLNFCLSVDAFLLNFFFVWMKQNTQNSSCFYKSSLHVRYRKINNKKTKKSISNQLNPHHFPHHRWSRRSLISLSNPKYQTKLKERNQNLS